jgi:hypothetical protein
VQSTLAAGKPSYAYTGDLHAAATILRTEGLRGTAPPAHPFALYALLDQAANNACWAALGCVWGRNGCVQGCIEATAPRCSVLAPSRRSILYTTSN